MPVGGPLAELLGATATSFARKGSAPAGAVRGTVRISAKEIIAVAPRTDNNLAQLAAIRANFGDGVCQVTLAKRGPSLVRVLPEQLQFDLDVWVVMHEDLCSNARCRAVLEALVDGLGNR